MRRFYIVWNPASEKPPRVVFHSKRTARAIARGLAKKHGQDFYVMQGAAPEGVAVHEARPAPDNRDWAAIEDGDVAAGIDNYGVIPDASDWEKGR